MLACPPDVQQLSSSNLDLREQQQWEYKPVLWAAYYILGQCGSGSRDMSTKTCKVLQLEKIHFFIYHNLQYNFS